MTQHPTPSSVPENSGAADKAAHPLDMTIVNKLDGLDFLANARKSMNALIDILSRETTLLRAGQCFKAAELSSEKTTITEGYFNFVRAIQHNMDMLGKLMPDEMRDMRDSHQALITQLSDNLRVIATARTLSQDILNNVARKVGATQAPQVYGASGNMAGGSQAPNGGLAVNRAL